MIYGINKKAMVLLIVGMSTLSFNLLGFFLGTSVVDGNHEYLSDAIPGYDYPIQDTSRLQNMLEKPMVDFELQDVNNAIFQSIIHSDKRQIQIYENWLLWLGGKIYQPLGRIQSPNRVVSGRGGCALKLLLYLTASPNLMVFEQDSSV